MAELNQMIDFEIIWKKINDRISDEEEILLKRWLDEQPSHRLYYENALRFYTSGTQFVNSPAELEKAMRNIHHKTGIRSPYRKTQIIAFTSIAASILLLLYFQYFSPFEFGNSLTTQQVQSIVPGSHKALLILDDGSEHDLSEGKNSIIDADGATIKNTGNKLEYISINGQPIEMRYNTLKIPRGGEYFLVLSDSTKVWLNSETTLRFPVQFASDTRSVELTGEAYFEVSKNAKVPFIVSTGNQMVKVMGTQFNISSYPENQTIYTTLIEGSVEISLDNNPHEKLILKPGEQSLLAMNSNQIIKKQVDVSSYIAWKYGRFVFQDQMLGDIMNTLTKWYDVEVVFSGEEQKKIRFTGNLERTDNFNNILEKIERTNEVKFEIKSNTITIK